MSLFHAREIKFLGASELIPSRVTGQAPSVASVSADRALMNSAVWACLRLRANLISSMPLDVFRKAEGRPIEVAKPPVLTFPGGPRVGMAEWLYSTQVELDRCGNAFGIIRERDPAGRPSRIDLVGPGLVTVLCKGDDLEGYRIRNTVYDPPDVWHEKQYTAAGLHVGLSPLAYAALTLSEYSSIQQFALDWFGNGTRPSAVLKNSKKTIAPDESREIKDRFKAVTAAGDVFVTGVDWEYSMLQAESSSQNWLTTKAASLVDVARFFDCPADIIDAAVSGQSITYANLTQRNLQLLIMHLGPAIARREWALSALTPMPRYVKLNTKALLRLDPAQQIAMFATQITSRQVAPSEVRELLDRAPFTEAQLAEFDRLFGPPNSQPTTPKTA